MSQADDEATRDAAPDKPSTGRKSPSGFTLRTATRIAMLFAGAAAVFYLLGAARDILLPLFLALFLATVLYPVVERLRRVRVPPSLGAAIVVLGIGLFLAGTFYALIEPATQWMGRAPAVMDQIERKLLPITAALEEARDASQKIEDAAKLDAESALQVAVQEGSLAGRVARGTWQMVQDGLVTLALLFFMLARGNQALRRAVAAISQPAMRRYVEEVLKGIVDKVPRYLATLTLVNIALGTVTGIAMWALGMPNPELWGVLAAVLSFVPYAGPVVTLAVIGAVSLLSFDGWVQIALPVAAYGLITLFEGEFITPAVIGRRLALNPIAVLLAIVFWYWVWGVPGAVMAVPILASIKAACTPVPALRPVAELIS